MTKSRAGPIQGRKVNERDYLELIEASVSGPDSAATAHLIDARAD